MKKALNIVKNILIYLIVAFAVCMMIFTIVSVTTLDKTERSLFGFKAFVVLTDSMSATDFKAGDLVIVKEVDAKTLQVGDIISYRSTNFEHYYEVVTHKIGTKWIDRTGRANFTTYGTTTGISDEEIVNETNVLGLYKFAIPKLGTFFQFLKTTPGYILCILMPFLLLILIQAIHSVNLFRRYKKETIEEMNEEKKKLETERLETEEIRKQLSESTKKTKKIEKELAELKKELATKKNNGKSPPKNSQKQTKEKEKKTTAKKATAKKTISKKAKLSSEEEKTIKNRTTVKTKKRSKER